MRDMSSRLCGAPILLVISALIILGCIAEPIAQGRSGPKAKKPVLPEATQNEVHDQRFHSEFPDVIPKLLARDNHQDVFIPQLGMPPFVVSRPAPELARDLVCENPLIVIGVVRSRQGRVSRDQSTVYTSFQIALSEVLKNDTAYEFAAGEQVRLLRPGGTATLASRRVHAGSPFQTQEFRDGERYLIFATTVLASTGAITDEKAVFSLGAPVLGGTPYVYQSLQNFTATELTQMIRRAVAENGQCRG
jgi:hypothetical protein